MGRVHICASAARVPPQFLTDIDRKMFYSTHFKIAHMDIQVTALMGSYTETPI